MYDIELIDKNILEFKEELKILSPIDIIRKHIIHGSSFILSNTIYYELRSIIAEKYSLHTNDVLIVGSAKLGFSIAPNKQYKHFGDTSDIDIVVVSLKLFDDLWKQVYTYWESGGYWENFVKFKDYLFQGWLRPDMLPPSKSFVAATEWWNFFRELSSSGKYSSIKVRGAIYKNWDFLESYQLRSVINCRDRLSHEEACI